MDSYDGRIFSDFVSLEFHKHKLSSRIKEAFARQDKLLEEGELTVEQKKKFLQDIIDILGVDIRPKIKETLKNTPKEERNDNIVYNIIMDTIENLSCQEESNDE